MSIHVVFDPHAEHCALCGDTGMVDVIPHGGCGNDAQPDECPWCLRRRMARPRPEPKPLTLAERFPPHAYKPNRKHPQFCEECGYAPHDSVKHIQPVVWPERKPEMWALGFCPCGRRLTKKTVLRGLCTGCQRSGFY